MPPGREGAILGPKKLYFIFAPPVVDTGSWDRHVDMYLNDVMNTPAPKYEHESTSDSMWIPMKVDFANGWEGGLMLDHAHLSEPHNSIHLDPEITAYLTVWKPWSGFANSTPTPRFCYGMMDESGALNGPVIPDLLGMVTRSATPATAVSDGAILLSDENRNILNKHCLIVHT